MKQIMRVSSVTTQSILLFLSFIIISLAFAQNQEGYQVTVEKGSFTFDGKKVRSRQSVYIPKENTMIYQNIDVLNITIKELSTSTSIYRILRGVGNKDIHTIFKKYIEKEALGDKELQEFKINLVAFFLLLFVLGGVIEWLTGSVIRKKAKNLIPMLLSGELKKKFMSKYHKRSE